MNLEDAPLGIRESHFGLFSSNQKVESLTFVFTSGRGSVLCLSCVARTKL